MKLLLDQGLPRSAASLLSERGIDTIHVGAIGLATATDAEILEQSRQSQCIVVTLDADFHALLALSNATTPSVIRIRLEGLKADDLADVIEKVLAQWGAELALGAVVMVDEERARMRRLPLTTR